MEAFLLPLILIAVFYFMLIRPQQKQRRNTQELQNNLAAGARVMTGSGLYGTVVSIEGDEVELEVAPGVTNRYARRAIMNVVNPTPLADDASGDLTDTTDPTETSDSSTDFSADDVPDSPADLQSKDRTNGDDAR